MTALAAFKSVDRHGRGHFIDDIAVSCTLYAGIATVRITIRNRHFLH
jgi:hypothetical protein